MSRSIRCLVVAVVLIGSIPLAGGGVATGAPGSPAGSPAGSLDVVITADGDVNRSRVVAAVARYGTVEGTADTGHLFVFASLPARNQSDVRAIPGVSSVTPDRPVALPAPARGVTRAGSGGGNVSTAGQSVPWGVARIDARAAASAVDESGVDVAVLDTGVDTDHPDLASNLAWGVNTTGEGTVDGLAAAEDADGHGTHVAGTIAALDNARGVVGVAPDVDLYAVKVQHGSLGRYRDLIEGIAAALAGPDGARGTDDDADVLSISLGGEKPTAALETAVADAAETAVVVAAAGNAGDGSLATNEVRYPAKYAPVIAVAATDRDDDPATFSSEGDEVDVAGPGVRITSTFLDGTYADASGTSMATPHVAGVAALLVARDGERTTAQFRSAIDAVDVSSSGEDGYTGQGRIGAPGTAGTGTNAAPSVRITAPGNGTTVDGAVEVRVDATDPDEPAGNLTASVSVDGEAVETRYDAADGRYEADWDTTTATEDATVTVTATVTDSAGASASAAVEVTVDNRNAAPTVRIERPANGTTVAGPTRVSVAASDAETPVGELSVALTANGSSVPIAYDASAGRYEAEWNASAVPGGRRYRLVARATDAGGETARDAVHVNSEGAPPAVSLDLSVPDRFPYGHPIPVRVGATLEDAGGGNATASLTVVLSASAPIGPAGNGSVTVARDVRPGAATTLTRRLVPDRSRRSAVTLTVRAEVGGVAVERTRSVRLVPGDAVLPTLDGRTVDDVEGDGTVDDLTGDGRVTLADAVALDAAANGTALNASQRAALDRTRDGTVSRADAHRLAELAGAGGALPSDPDGDGVYEDLDGDGGFTILDVAWLLERFDDPDAWVGDLPARADVNGDGRLDVIDVAALLEEV